MELYVLDRNLDVLGMVDAYNSVSHLRKYYDVDTLSLQCFATNDHCKLLRKGNILVKSTDVSQGFVIVQREGEDKNGDDENLSIEAVCVTTYLSRRIIWERMIIQDTAEQVMKNLVSTCCIHTDADRKIPLLEIGPTQKLGKRIHYQVSYKNLLEELKTLSEGNELSFVVALDIPNKKLLFQVWEGKDRSLNQNTLPPCVFKKEFENIIEQNFVESYSDFKNIALVAGAGEGSERKRITVGGGSGLDRFELFVDARDLQDTKTEEVTNSDGEKEEKEVPIPEEEYKAMLRERGRNKLAECKEIFTFDSKINIQGNLVYKKDFDLGDIITAISEKYGMAVQARITEIEEIYDTNGFSVHATLGNNIPTLIDKIKKTVG
ncbi:hypothetical protein ERICIV_00897 [Paenibacillus larvae subsp. larvae]|uniref:Gp28/Gp37-like domain-containing protein n=1 Tax=Paenibacillus larvae subsp. larvae TaxID=147375 RepID=A0A2L1TWM9_9BACL|nr:siphovirus ReqiPepy6 Gp37-like family protein [Paenibacillus larvae]AQT85699.1 hypothetical protein B1222_16830 [Paenibacillus larvae subsp. pulvifaciens]AVF25101.1 hypothetical protein ERICIII_00894 [Paenibacillus larvae subsp. larvae]AVF29865.1 hypothetical protein ERICIV_00897 [Paenibacillus larvae subsp. larvae]MBH0342266.1 hypothetical protein [Paenibacillus larvae]MCY7520674.1 siphovirus ReqiPepy6 Gp37-like family protein [Paenibacillus larvae]